MYQALGRGLVSWQYIETALYLIALALMGADPTSCSLAFFQIKAAEAKLTLVDRLILHKLTQRTRTEFWRPISDEIRDAIDFRNALAHFESFTLSDDELAKCSPKTAFRSVLSPNHLDHHAKRSGSVKILSIETMEQNAHELRVIAFRLMYFLVDHIPHSETLSASLEPNLRQWFDSFHKSYRPPGFEPPQQPSHSKANSQKE